MFRRRLYMDFASAAPLHKDVAREMLDAMSVFGNPSAPHEEGRAAKELLESARARIARALKVRSETLHFTSSGTEANNLGTAGFIEALVRRGARYDELHIIVSAFEHPSVYEPVRALEKKGVRVSYVFPTPEGSITPESVAREVRLETVLVSIAAVQGEIGQIEPLKDIARSLEEFQKRRAQKNQQYVPECSLPVLHSDASQGPMYSDVAPERLGATLVSYDAHKIMGPKGVGLLYKHSSAPIEPLLRGGSQERLVRPGTENVLGAVGMARAFELAIEGRDERVRRVTAVRDSFVEMLQKEMPDVSINGGMARRIANNVHISVPDADGDYLSILMDKEGISVSPRSACIASGAPSPTLKALGKDERYERGTLRFTFGPAATTHEARRAVEVLKRCRKIIDSL